MFLSAHSGPISTYRIWPKSQIFLSRTFVLSFTTCNLGCPIHVSRFLSLRGPYKSRELPEENGGFFSLVFLFFYRKSCSSETEVNWNEKKKYDFDKVKHSWHIFKVFFSLVILLEKGKRINQEHFRRIGVREKFHRILIMANDCSIFQKKTRKSWLDLKLSMGCERDLNSYRMLWIVDWQLSHRCFWWGPLDHWPYKSPRNVGN
jgi:hypothetical protein